MTDEANDALNPPMSAVELAHDLVQDRITQRAHALQDVVDYIHELELSFRRAGRTQYSIEELQHIANQTNDLDDEMISLKAIVKDLARAIDTRTSFLEVNREDNDGEDN